MQRGAHHQTQHEAARGVSGGRGGELSLHQLEGGEIQGGSDLPRPPGPGGQCDGGAQGESEAEVQQLPHSPHQPHTAGQRLPGRGHQVLFRR